MIDHLNQSDQQLIALAQSGDQAAMEALSLRHDALVRYVTRRFVGRGKEMDDLNQLGRLGLVKAIKNFDPEYGVRFSTYAVPLILGEIRRFLRDDGQIHIARSIRENAARAARLTQERGEGMTVGEIARELGISLEEAVLAVESGRAVRSLNEPIAESDSLLLQDTIGEDHTDKMLADIELRRLLDGLPPFERELIERRYFREQTQTSIAAEWGMTQVQISRMESRILKRLREMAV